MLPCVGHKEFEVSVHVNCGQADATNQRLYYCSNSYRTYTYANVQYTMLLKYVSTPQNISHSVMTLRRLSMQEMVKRG